LLYKKELRDTDASSCEKRKRYPCLKTKWRMMKDRGVRKPWRLRDTWKFMGM